MLGRDSCLALGAVGFPSYLCAIMGFWFTRGLSFLPIFVIVWTYLTFGISYIIAVARGDVDPGFPYISDTGARRPESSIFGQMLNMTAAVGMDLKSLSL